MVSLARTQPLILPTIHSPKSLKLKLNLSKATPTCRSLRCSLSVVSESPQSHLLTTNNNKSFPAEVSRTIMELSSSGTLSTLTQDTWPIGVAVRFALDPQGTPFVCFNFSNTLCFRQKLEQCALRTLQCTIQGNVDIPGDQIIQKRFQSLWEKRFGEEVDEDLIYVLAVERVLQIEDFMEIASSDYRLASPDPLWDIAEKLVHEINAHNMEYIQRFCNIYVDSDIQVSDTKIVWVDRLGFDMLISSPQNDVFEARIPFPREVSDEKGAKSSFNCMPQLAWEVGKELRCPRFPKGQTTQEDMVIGWWVCLIC